MPREDDVEIISIDDEEDSSSVEYTRIGTKKGTHYVNILPNTNPTGVQDKKAGSSPFTEHYPDDVVDSDTDSIIDGMRDHCRLRGYGPDRNIAFSVKGLTDQQLEHQLTTAHNNLKEIQLCINELAREKRIRIISRQHLQPDQRLKLRKLRGLDPDGRNEMSELLKVYDAADDPRTYPHDDEDKRLWRKLEGEYYLYRQRGGQYPKQSWHTGEESLYVNYPLRRESMHHPDWTWENDWEHQFPIINLFLNTDYYRWFSETHAKEILDTEGDYPFLSIEAARAAWKQRRLQLGIMIEDDLSSFRPNHLFNKDALLIISSILRTSWTPETQ